jgi:hypothetical protein
LAFGYLKFFLLLFGQFKILHTFVSQLNPTIMKKTLLFILAIAGASAFAQNTSDTLFFTFKTHHSEDYMQILLMKGEFYDMGLVKGVLYEFKKKDEMIFALPLDRPLTAPLMIYPEANHVEKYGDLWKTERWAKMMADEKKGL